MTTKTKAKSKSKKVTPISVGKPLATSIEAFVRRYTVEREFRGGMVVRDKRTGKLLTVYGDKAGSTVIEPYTQK